MLQGRTRFVVVVAMLPALAACAPAPRAPGVASEALPQASVLYLATGGVALAVGAMDDAVTNTSQVAGANVPAFNGAIVAPAVAAVDALAVVVDRVRTLYLPFAVDVTTTRPTSGDYAMVAVGGTAAVLTPAAPEDSAGIAELDCNDADADSVGFAFSDELSPEFGGAIVLAAAIAHEAGHGYGLEHVVTTTDPMYSVATPAQTLDDLFVLAFGSGDYSPFNAGEANQVERCGHADPLDNAALLTTVLGARTPTSAAPTVHIDSPLPAATMPETIQLQISASDDVAVVRVEVYRDVTLVAVLNAPPYEVSLTMPPADQTRLTVEAVDADAQRASAHLVFAVVAEVPVDAAVPADAALAVDAGEHATSGHGCAFAGEAEASGSSACLLLLIFAMARAIRSRC
jgi:hypothetical protein